MQRSFSARLEALERLSRRHPQLPARYWDAFDRAFDLEARGVSVEAWPDAELDAYCENSCLFHPELATMSDAELEARYAEAAH